MMVLLHVLIVAQVAQLLSVVPICIAISRSGASPSTGPSNRKK